MRKKYVSAVIFFIVLCSGLCAQKIRFAPDKTIPDKICKTEVMDAENFAYAALVASGTPAENISSLIEKLHFISNSINKNVSEFADNGKKADETLMLLYQYMLYEYKERQTRIDVALTNGTYNCVSSAVLFMYLLKKQNIPVHAVETPLHAFCSVSADGMSVDVETTNPWGYNPGVKKHIEASTTKNRYMIVPAKNYANRREVDDRRIIALIYNNRMAVLQKQGKNAETIPLACDALRLQDNSEKAMNTLYQTVYNTAVDYANNGENEKSLALVDEAEKKYGSSPSYEKCISLAVRNMLTNDMDKNNYRECYDILLRYEDKLSADEYTELYGTVAYNELYTIATTLPFEKSSEEVKLKKNSIPEKQYRDLISYIYSNAAQSEAKANGWLSAVTVINAGLAEIPGDVTLVKQRSVYKDNFAVGVHNKAADLYNSGDIAGAVEVLRKGLEQYSESSLLKKDMQNMQQALNNN